MRQAKGTDFGLSSAATTLILVTEVAICLAGLVIIGLGDWSCWLRPVNVIGLAAFLFMAWAVHTSGHSFAAPTRLREHAGFRMIADEVRRFRAGAVALVQPRILAIQGLFAALYLLDIGLLEVSGVGALVALGANETAAVGVMLINRVLSIGASVAIALVAVVVLRGELRSAFQERPSHPSVRSPVTTPADDS